MRVVSNRGPSVPAMIAFRPWEAVQFLDQGDQLLAGVDATTVAGDSDVIRRRRAGDHVLGGVPAQHLPTHVLILVSAKGNVYVRRRCSVGNVIVDDGRKGVERLR